jgi:beta-carotene 15,15'-dioxygenase
MLQSEQKMLVQLRTFSRYSILLGLFISLPLSYFFPDQIGWQVVLALVALAVGIPHGAVDHIVTVPKFPSVQMTLFLIGYLAVTGLAIWFLLVQNLIGFQLIVVISAIHFGVGDASFISELDKRQGRTGFPKISYALAAGFTPVMIPLVNTQSAEALAAVNPLLINWAGEWTDGIFYAVIALNLLATALMLIRKRTAEAIDLLALLGISLIAPPLVAFAFYFGLWHALRHTGRLTFELPKAKAQHEAGNPSGAVWQAVKAGLPALILVLGFTLVLGLATGFDLAADALWYLLVVIWALTVPHMALTARLDAKAMGFRS